MSLRHLILVVASLAPACAHAQAGASSSRASAPRAAGAVRVPRRVLALYVSPDDARDDVDRSSVFLRLQTPLEVLGHHLIHHDLRRGPATLSGIEHDRLVAFWSTSDRIPHAADTVRLLTGAARRGRVILVGVLPRAELNGEAVPAALVRDLEAALGLVDERRTHQLPAMQSVTHRSDHFGGRSDLDLRLKTWRHVRSTRATNVVHLSVRDTISGLDSDLVVTGPHGLVAFNDALYRESPNGRRFRWLVEIIPLLEEALGCRGRPIPNPAVRLGHRVGYVHADGDGWFTPSAPDGRLCGPRLARLFLDSGIPATLSIITAEFDRTVRSTRLAPGPSQGVLEVLRKLATEPLIRLASHTVRHPFDWVVGSAQYPSPDGRHDPVAEVCDSVAFINSAVLTPPRRCETVFWSGSCRPGVAAIDACDDAGLLSINGGDPRLDEEFPCIGELSPLVIQSGPVRPDGSPRLQVATTGASEFVYTDGATRDLYRFRSLIETWERTAAVPLRAVNLYCHAYAIQHAPGQRALAELVAWIRSRKLHMVFVADYIKAVRGFCQARIEASGSDGFRIRRYGACRTVTLRGERRVPDLARSTGVIGFRRRGIDRDVVLDVFLDVGEVAELRLTDRSTGPYVRRSQASISHWSATASEIRFDVELLGPSRVVLGGLTPGQIWSGSDPARESGPTVDSDGRLVLTLAGFGRRRIRLRR